MTSVATGSVFYRLNSAIWSRQPQIVQDLTQSDTIQEISDETLGFLFLESFRYPCQGMSEILASACLKRHSFKVIDLLPNYSLKKAGLSDNQSGWALKCASEFGLSSIVQALLRERFREFKCFFAGQAVIYAAKKGHTDILRLLRESEHLVCPCIGCVGAALLHGAARGHVEGMKILLKSQYVLENLNTSYFRYMLSSAEHSQNAETIEFAKQLIQIKQGLDQVVSMKAGAFLPSSKLLNRT